MRTLRTVSAVLLAMMALFGCDSNDESGIPQVGGEYEGELRITEADTPNISFNFQMTANVIQRDEDVTITATIVVDGRSETEPAITGEISKTGFFTPAAGGTVRYRPPSDDENCGAAESSAGSITFEDNVMIYNAELTYETCEFNAIARLTREE